LRYEDFAKPLILWDTTGFTLEWSKLLEFNVI